MGSHFFPPKVFCLAVPENFVGEHFGDLENFGYRKILCIIGEYHDFPLISQDRIISLGDPGVPAMFWSRKFLDNKGITILSKRFCLYRKTSWGNSNWFQKNSDLETSFA